MPTTLYLDRLGEMSQYYDFVPFWVHLYAWRDNTHRILPLNDMHTQHAIRHAGQQVETEKRLLEVRR